MTTTTYGTVIACADGAEIRPATREEWLASVRAAAAGPMPNGYSIIPTWHEQDAGLMVYVQGGPEDEDEPQASADVSGPQRFALDEEKAAEWLAARDDLDDYQPATEWDATQTFLLVSEAQDEAVITIAGRDPSDSNPLVFEFIPDGDGDGYRWIVYHDEYGNMITSTRINGMKHLGGGYEARGADAAMDVLREAVREGNALTSRLLCYVSSLPVAVRAPEVANAVRRCQRLQHELDEHPNGLVSPRAVLARQVQADLGVSLASPYIDEPDLLMGSTGRDQTAPLASQDYPPQRG